MPEGLAPANKGPSAATSNAPGMAAKSPEQPDAIAPRCGRESRSRAQCLRRQSPVGPQRPLKLLPACWLWPLWQLALCLVGANRMGRSPSRRPLNSARSPSTPLPGSAAHLPWLRWSLPSRLPRHQPVCRSGRLPSKLRRRVRASLTPELPPAAAAGTRSGSRPALNPIPRDAGYSHPQGSPLDAARGITNKPCKPTPGNLDALRPGRHRPKGGRAGDADRYHQQALEADPKIRQPRPRRSPRPLRSIRQVPKAASKILWRSAGTGSLNFALGNLYSRQSRWAEAQAGLFQRRDDGRGQSGLSLQSGSLDHLRQSRLAAQYYRQALGAATAVRPPRPPTGRFATAGSPAPNER